MSLRTHGAGRGSRLATPGLFLALGVLCIAVASHTRAENPQPSFRNPPPAVLDEAAVDGGGGGFTGTAGLTNVPPGAFQQDRVGIPQSSLFRNTQLPYGQLTESLPLGPSVRTTSVSADFKLTLPGLSGGLPFAQRAFEPQNADIKLGPFFFKLRAVEAAMLYSDNIYLSPQKQSGEIAFLGVTIEMIAQITSDLRIATSGTLVYLPLQNKVGFAGFGLNDIYQFGLAAGPIARAQIQWDTLIAGWNVVFMDDFQIYQGVYSDQFQSNDALFQGGNYNDQAVAGRYVLRPNESNIFSNAAQNNRNTEVPFRTNLVVYSNTLSAHIDRLLPGEIRLSAEAFHEDLWYNQGNRGLPALREGATVSLASEHENTRFKPYFIYQAFRTDEFSGVQSIFRLGVRGPITSQLKLQAEAGYFTGSQQGSGDLWFVDLDHTIGPYTHQSLIYSRTFDYFHDEIDEQVGYSIQQIIGPKVSSDLYIYHIQAQDFYADGNRASYGEWRAGLRFTFAPGPKTSIRLTGEYAEFEPFATQAFIGRVELGYNFSNNLLLYFVYQYQQSRSQEFGLGYNENLFFLSLTKYFE